NSNRQGRQGRQGKRGRIEPRRHDETPSVLVLPSLCLPLRPWRFNSNDMAKRYSAREVERVAGDAGGVFDLAVFDWFGGWFRGGLGGLGGSFPEAAAVGVAFGGFLVLFGFADAGGAFGLGFRLGVALLDRGIFGGSFRLGPRELRQGCS